MSDDGNFPTLEDMLSGRFQFGADFDPTADPKTWLKDVQAEAMKPRIELAQAYAKVFTSPEGKKVLEHLVEQTHRKTTWLGGLHLPLEIITTYGLWREGQNSIVQIIVEHVRLGQAKQTKPRKS